MATLALRYYPDPVLKTKTKPVTVFDATLHQLLDDMRETMYTANGVGLAAPQVGKLIQVCVIDVTREGNSPIDLINPEITIRAGTVPSEEGCLSIPGYRDTISRSERVTIKACDRNGAPIEIAADGLLAICAQHEIDHLLGKLFIDHLSRIKKELFMKWLKKNGPLNAESALEDE